MGGQNDTALSFSHRGLFHGIVWDFSCQQLKEHQHLRLSNTHRFATLINIALYRFWVTMLICGSAPFMSVSVLLPVSNYHLHHQHF